MSASDSIVRTLRNKISESDNFPSCYSLTMFVPILGFKCLQNVVASCESNRSVRIVVIVSGLASVAKLIVGDSRFKFLVLPSFRVNKL